MSSGVQLPNSVLAGLRRFAKNAAVWLLIATLAWAPFPLGGAIAWAAGVQELLIALCWLLWVVGTAGDANEALSTNRVILAPLMLGAATLVWALIQITPGIPQSWVHPAWSMAADALGVPLKGVISLNPWQTEAEILKLVSYGMAAWLAFRMARHTENAKLLLNAVILIGALYAAYAFALAFAGALQTAVFYAVPYRDKLMSGPFMLHNSFATCMGLVALAAIARVFAFGSETIVADRGWKRLIESTLSFVFGRGAPIVIASLLPFAAVIASASRAGFASTMLGLATLALTSLTIMRSRGSRTWAIAGATMALAPLLVLILLNGDTLDSRLSKLFAADMGDQIRLSLWAATQRMIADAPLLGLGLGTFEDAYPLYASQVFPFVMDKAHSDYLEFAAGIGLPAAIAWWVALIWLTVLCIKGARNRRRDRIYAMIAVSASVLVAVHSCVDFSLQLPAVALLYATLLGLGVAQSQSSRERRRP